jgi:hypothetical protein
MMATNRLKKNIGVGDEMKNILTFGSEEAGSSASIKIYGGPDAVNIYLYRGSTIMDQYIIFLHPSWLHELRDQIYNIGLGINKTPREYYNAKIRGVVKQYSIIANNYVAKDKLQIQEILEDRKTSEQNYEEYKKYIDTLITEMETK